MRPVNTCLPVASFRYPPGVSTHYETEAHMFSKQILNRHFARHYGVMVLVMFIGMGVLGLPAAWALGAAGSSWSELGTDSPELMLGLMAFTMTLPMSAWMYRMGHALRPNVEMALSMIVPTLGV